MSFYKIVKTHFWTIYIIILHRETRRRWRRVGREIGAQPQTPVKGGCPLHLRFSHTSMCDNILIVTRHLTPAIHPGKQLLLVDNRDIATMT